MAVGLQRGKKAFKFPLDVLSVMLYSFYNLLYCVSSFAIMTEAQHYFSVPDSFTLSRLPACPRGNRCSISISIPVAMGDKLQTLVTLAGDFNKSELVTALLQVAFDAIDDDYQRTVAEHSMQLGIDVYDAHSHLLEEVYTDELCPETGRLLNPSRRTRLWGGAF